MTVTKSLGNAIYLYLLPKSEAVKRVQALFVWNRPAFSAAFLVFLELLFVLCFFLPFSKICNSCLVIGSFIILYCAYGAFPSAFGKLLSFEIAPVDPPGRPDRIRTVKEVAAFLTTLLSFWTKVLEMVFSSIEGASFLMVIATGFILLTLFIVTFLMGDFCFIWVMFHMTFVLPGIMLLPPVQRWLMEEIDGDGQAPAVGRSPSVDPGSSDGEEEKPEHDDK
jgi:hypothetical protein